MTKKFTILFFLMLIARVSFAQGIKDTVIHIESVTVTSDRIFKKEEAGMKETKVDSLVLIEKINLSLSDVLAENTTVYIKDYGRGALATASFRGTAPTHAQVSWNGININSPMLGMVDFSLIPVYIVDELSLQHGAASVSESSGGLGGHISINNTVDWNNRLSGRYYQGIGSFSTYDEYGQVNIGNKNVQSKTRAYHNYSKNEYEFSNSSILNDDIYNTGHRPRQQTENADYKKYGFSQEFYLKASDRIISSAKVWFQDAHRSIPLVTSYQGSDKKTTKRENRQDDITLKAVLDGAYYGNKITGKFKSGIDYQRLDYIMKIKVGGYDWQKPVNSGSDMKSWYNNLQLKYQLSEKWDVDMRLNGNYFQISTIDSANHTGYDENRSEYSVFGRTSYELLKKVNLQASLRKDFIPNATTPLIYVVGISYKPLLYYDLVAKASFSRNFHNPTLNDLFWQPGGNPDLKPEKGHTLEGGLHYIGQSKKISFETQLTGYYSDINDWILWLPSTKGYWEAINVKRVKSYGLETNLKGSYNLNHLKLVLFGNYALTKTLNFGDPLTSADESTGMQLPFIPVHSGNILFSFGYKGFFSKFQYNFYGIRYLLSSNKTSLADDSHFFGVESPNVPFYRLYPYHFKHLTLGKEFKFKTFNFETEVKIHNLFNEEYRSVLGRPMPKRYYTLIIKISF
ncbi:MAG: TonB-dependent receptor [Bacteroidales bacterium]|nr:TonB-dependent receptor [Bacteroidales bacterium]